MSSSEGRLDSERLGRAGLVRQVVDECIERNSSDRDWSEDEVIAAHRELMPELGVELRKLHLIQRARLQATQTETQSAAPLPATLPFALEGYELVREIHRGGQGVVYQAIQKSTKRKVAIKVLHGGPFADARCRARLDREIQILGQFSHPHIVRVVDSGVVAGCPYYVMDYVSGEALDVYVRQAALPVRQTLELFAKVCEAVSAAHLRGVIHRDLKPGNIRVDADGEPRVLDFGLARVAADAVTGGEHPQLMSATGQFIGSLPWASPEQAEGLPDKIDLRTDVYALGVILFQLLTGQFPYDVVGGMHDVLERIRTVPPPRPSSLRHELDGELDTIILRCLAKERERRYQSAGELARDVRHYLAGEPLEARRDSLVYLLRKQLRRYRAAVAVAAAFVLLIGAAWVTSLAFWRQSVAQQQRAEAQAARAELVANLLDEILSSVDPEVAQADRGPLYAALRSGLDQAAARADTLRDQPEVEARVRHTLGRVYKSLGMYPQAEEQLRRAADLRRAVLGSRNAATAETLHALAIVLAEQGRFAEARSLLDETLTIRVELFGSDSLPVAEGLASLGALLLEQLEYAEAEPYLRSALELRQRLGASPAEQAGTLSALGSVLRGLERLDEAESVLREALRIRRESLGPSHPLTVCSLNRLGLLLKAKGDLAGARAVFEEALDLRKNVLDERHPHVAVSHCNLAQLLVAERHDQDAIPHFERALGIWRETQPPEHADTRIAVLNLAGSLVRLKRFEEAERLLLGRYSQLADVVGSGDPRTVETAEYLVRLYTAWEKPGQADEWRTVVSATRPQSAIQSDDTPPAP